MPRKKLVVLGLLGTTLDRSQRGDRWKHWRPTVSVCQHEDLLVDRLELIHSAAHAPLAAQISADVAQVSPETEVRRHVVELGDPWDLERVYGALYDFAASYPFRPEREDYLVHITTGSHIAQISMFLLTEARYLPARLLQTSPPHRAGRDGSSSDPAVFARGTYTIIDLDLSSYDHIASRFRREAQAGAASLKLGIDTRNAAFNALIARIEAVALASRDPILLTGPTGSGKSQLAARIYALKKARHRVEGAFVPVNCATLRGDAAMSTLFGHEKGAFTGAVSARAGMLRKADRGVLFLDEIGELGLDEQAMLLRAIEEKSFYPMGADREVRSDFELIAGTNRDLVRAVGEGTFRDDLLARLDVWTFRLPALRDRPEDLAPNLDYELTRLSSELNVRVTMSRDARERFLAFGTAEGASWPGNFRDLHAAVRRMAILSPAGRIDGRGVRDEIARLEEAWRDRDRSGPENTRDDGRGATRRDHVARLLGAASNELDPFDRVQLDEVLRVCGESASLSEAGRQLFAASRARKRSTNDADRLRKYLARFGLSWGDIRA